MTIGDVLAVIALTLLIVSSWVCLLVMAIVLTPARVEAAREKIDAGAGRCALRGLLALLLVVIPTAIIGRGLVGGARLLPLVVYGVLIVFAILGSSGIVQIIARRLEQGSMWSTEPNLSRLTRAATFYTLAGLFPIAGWMVVTPAALLVSLGAGLPSLPKKHLSRPEGHPFLNGKGLPADRAGEIVADHATAIPQVL